MNPSIHVDLPMGNKGLRRSLSERPCFTGSRRLADLQRGGPCTLVVLALMVAAGATVSCGRKKAVASVPPPPVAVAEPEPPRRPSAPVSEPQTAAKLPPPQPIPADAIPEFVGPLAVDARSTAPPDADKRQPERQPSSAGAQTTHPAEPVETQEPSAVPQLGRILSAEERQAYNRMIDRSIESARRSLAAVLKQPLNADQNTAVRRIRAFIEQADAARAQDLALARNLADRAELLAADLARSVP